MNYAKHWIIPYEQQVEELAVQYKIEVEEAKKIIELFRQEGNENESRNTKPFKRT